MAGETLRGPDGPDEMYAAGPYGEYPASTEDIVGSRTVPAPGVKSEAGFQEAVRGSRVRTLLADLFTHGIHGEPTLPKPHEITIFTSRNKAMLATVATAAAVGTAAYALRRHRRNATRPG